MTQNTYDKWAVRLCDLFLTKARKQRVWDLRNQVQPIVNLLENVLLTKSEGQGQNIGIDLIKERYKKESGCRPHLKR